MPINITALNSACLGLSYKKNKLSEKNELPSAAKPSIKNNFALFDMNRAMLNRSLVSFKGYYGDPQPLKKLFWISTGRNDVYEDNWTKDHLYQIKKKKWVNAHPAELLKHTPEQTIQSLCTLIKPDNQYPGIPPYIPSPNFGDKWGRRANYIEINPRVIAKYDNNSNRLTDGLLNTMKLMRAIPTSPNSFANCIVLSQLYPCIYGDGYDDAASLYCANLHTGISQTLTADGLYAKMGADEQVKAFNDMAHLLGFKTAFRIPLSAGQLRIQGREFNWYDHEKAFIDACVWGIELGFDAIYFDSAKHITDRNGYSGVGDLPNKNQMGYILYKIREQTGRSDLAFVGEKCDNRYDYKEMGFTAGTDWGKADDFNSVRWESEQQSWSGEYAGGPEVSNDNDDGGIFYPQRLNRINSCLFGYRNIGEKLPSFMQMHDIFPLSPYSNTHEVMMHAKQMSGSDAWTKCERHYDGAFNTSPAANDYRNNVYHIFENVIKTYG